MKSYSLLNIVSPRTFRETVQPIVPFLRGEYFSIIFAIFAVMFNSVAAVATPYLISLAIDEYITNSDLQGLTNLLIWLSILYTVIGVISFLQTRVVGRISQKILFRLRKDLFLKIQLFPLMFFQQNTAGDVITRVNNDTEKLNNFLGGGIFQFISSFFSFVGIGVFIFFLNWRLALVVWVMVLVVVLISAFLSPKVRDANKSGLQTNSELTSFLDENLSNYKALVVFNKGGYLKEVFSDINQKTYSLTMKAQIFNGLYNPFYSFAGNIAQVFVLGAGLYFLNQGSISIGLLIAFITYTQRFYEPLRTIGSIWGTIQEASAAWIRILELLKLT